MRSEYSWIPAGPGVTRTRPNQVGVSFSQHVAAEYQFGDRLIEADIRPGSVFVTGQESITWTRIQETTEALEIYPDADVPDIQPAAASQDGTVLAVASMLKRAHVADRPISDVEASTLSHLLVEHLRSRYCAAHRVEARLPGQLDRRIVDRIAEFVDAELSGEITLDQLAAIARLSPFHFARAFRASTGLAPHQFVTSRRMDRATRLLVGSTASVTEVAHAVGLSNVSHFRRLFHSHAGLLPSQLRANEDRKNRSSRDGLPVRGSAGEFALPDHQR
jgi:AraC family transcriptional regulator